MEDIRARFTAEIAVRFSAAPDSAAKFELIEELSDNLCLRYKENLASGLTEEAAFNTALDGLGDVTELVRYLNSLSPEQAHTADPFDELVKDIEDITQSVFSKAKSAIKDAERRLREEGFFNYTSPKGRVSVNVSNGPGAKREAASKGDKIYGVGYDKAKGGFFAQWGEWKGEREDLSPETPFPADKLRGIDVRIVNGDVTVRFSEPENGQVLFSGSVEELEVSRTADDVLLIRQGRTASSSSLFRRGLSASDVELCLPCRDWEFLQINTANGDIELEGDCCVGSVSVKSATGDINGRLDSCSTLTLDTASGDIEWDGHAENACVGTASGDIRMEGSFGGLTASSMSGDIDVAGSVSEAGCSSLSGEVELESEVLPAGLSISSKSGDCGLRLPDLPFSVRVSTVSGDVDSFFPVRRVSGGFVCGTGDSPEFSVSTVSGDVRIEKY